MLRQTLTTLLLGTSLLTAACKKTADVAAPSALATDQAIAAPASPSPSPADPAAGVMMGSAANLAAAAGSGSGGAQAVLAAADTTQRATPTPRGLGTESYHDWGRNPWTETATDHLSTFAADVDTASYTIARRKLNEGSLPPAAAVRVEEFVNYFKYKFPEPAAGSPFAVVIDAAPSPLSPGRDVLRVAVATKPKSIDERKPAHLVFLVDVSGSMSTPDKLALAKQSLQILTNNLNDGDTVAIVSYAGATKLVLPPTGIGERDKIQAAIAALHTGGSTGMASGIDLAYAQAAAGLSPGTISRVLVLTDGDANVGAHTHDEMLAIIAGRAKEGVTLSTIGFGMGNYKDDLMEQLADKGNGNNYYIDSLAQAKRVFQEQLGSTLEVVAKDVKLQVDFDPTLVARYRLIGYENRDVADEDFRNDRVDAGQVGAGHQVTALYELERTAAGKLTPAPLATLHIRHKAPNGEHATEAAFAMPHAPLVAFDRAPMDFRFAFAVAAFADTLRHGQDAEHWSLASIRELARNADDGSEDRAELVGLIQRAIEISDRAAMR